MYLTMSKGLLSHQSPSVRTGVTQALQRMLIKSRAPVCAYSQCMKRKHCNDSQQRCSLIYRYPGYSTAVQYIDRGSVNTKPGIVRPREGRYRQLSVSTPKFDSHCNKWGSWTLWALPILAAVLIVTAKDTSLHADCDVNKNADTVEDIDAGDSKDLEARRTKDVDEVDRKKGSNEEFDRHIQEAISKCRNEIKQQMKSRQIPGMSVAVSVDGKVVWAEGFGYSDLENHVPFKPETVLNIASISKPITMVAVARLWEQGLLDLDKPVQYYVPEFPQKYWKGKKVTITTRQLVSHMGGIRHYYNTRGTDPKEREEHFKMWRKEVHNKKQFNSATEALDMFKDDPLVTEPGTKTYYSSFGWNLVSAVVEKVVNMPFEKYLDTLLKDLGLNTTYLDREEPIIYNRGRHYNMERGKYENTPYVNWSYKWGAEGIMSNVLDLNKFGNIMLYSYQNEKDMRATPGYLKSDTVKMMWEMNQITNAHDERKYGMGWVIDDVQGRQCGVPRVIYHTGLSVGACNILCIVPAVTKERQWDDSNCCRNIDSAVSDLSHQECSTLPELNTLDEKERIPEGVVVCVMANLDNGVIPDGVKKIGFKIAQTFSKCKSESSR